MKKSFKTTKINFAACLLSLFLCSFAQASPIAVVNSVRGEAFVTHNGKTQKLRQGQYIYNLSTIITSIDGQISFNDYFDHRYHLSHSGQIRLGHNTIELHRGYFWVQSLGQHNQGFNIETANARLNYATGEGIFSFDPDSGRSQFMSISGTFEFGNLMERELNVVVRSGEFSFISGEQDDGVPRRSTVLGQRSMQNIVALFDQAKMSGSQSIAAPKRAPASVEAALVSEASKSGTIQFIPLKKELQGPRMNLVESYTSAPKARTPKRAPASVQKKANVEIQVFGRQAPKAVKRAPASVAPASESVEEIIRQARKPQNDFERGLNESYKKQMRHSNEVNSLIRDLKNYNIDYNPSF